MTSVQQLFADYVHDLRKSASRLNQEDGAELVSGVEAHLQQAVASGTVTTDVEAKNLLERLGSPSVLVDQVDDRPSEVGTAPEADQPSAKSIVFWLTTGSFIPVLGWLFGIVRLWSSNLWSSRDKIIGTVFFPFGSLGALIVFSELISSMGFGCSGGSFGEVDGPGGGITSDETVEMVCSFSGSNPWLAGIAAAVVVGLAVFGPTWLWMKTRRKS